MISFCCPSRGRPELAKRLIDTATETQTGDTEFLFYLNDSDGETYFPEHDVTIHPKCGKVLVFPPTWEYPHAGLPPTNTKYILSTYIHYE